MVAAMGRSSGFLAGVVTSKIEHGEDDTAHMSEAGGTPDHR